MTEAEADELNVVLILSGLFKRAGIAPHADFCCPGSYRRSAFAAQVAGHLTLCKSLNEGCADSAPILMHRGDGP
jgi:hypothetical protein